MVLRKLGVYFFFSYCLLQVAHAAESGRQEITADGRFGSACPMIGLQTGNIRICTVSFYKLLAEPERYDSKYVKVFGVLGDYLGSPALFPQRESYDAMIASDAFLVADPIPASINRDIGRGVWPVVVVGKFDAKFTAGLFAGRISDIQNIELVNPPKHSK